MASMIALNTGLRARRDHTTFSEALFSFGASDLLEGEEVWIALADGNEVLKGDTWLKVTKRNGAVLATPGWSAYIHKGIKYCKDFQNGTPPPPPVPEVDPNIKLDLVVTPEGGVVSVTVNGKVYREF